MLKATVSGSFHRHMTAIYDAVGDLRLCGVEVLSPSDPRVVDHIGEFLFVASDRLRSIKLVQDRHLEAIRTSDFLLVVCPDGYTGASTSGEIMAAAVLGVPVFSLSPATDITLGQYVRTVRDLAEIPGLLTPRPRAAGGRHVLLDPEGSVEAAMESLRLLGPALTVRGGGAEAEIQLASTRSLVGRSLGLVHGE